MSTHPGDIPRFIAIDDDPINNMICRLTIEMVADHPEIVAFTDPMQGLDFMRTEYQVSHNKRPSVLLLDINMPGMSGWEFLEKFDQLSTETKDLIQIYILSSSVDDRDRQRSYANKNVKDFLVKPLVKNDVVKILKR